MVRYKLSLISTVAACLLVCSWSANAAPLNLTLNLYPDIAAGLIDVSYDAGTDVLSADGFAFNLSTDPGPAINIVGGLFSLSATVDSTGALSGGSVTISGTIASLGYNSGTLLTGALTNFGFVDSGGDPLGFLFDVTGGDAAALYGPVGGIILSSTNFPGSFDADFNNNGGIPGSGSGVADIAAVPVPAAVWLMVSALMGLGATARKRTA